jgi:hypothetical protein
VTLIFGSGSNLRGAHAKCSTINGRSIGDALDLEHWQGYIGIAACCVSATCVGRRLVRLIMAAGENGVRGRETCSGVLHFSAVSSTCMSMN